MSLDIREKQKGCVKKLLQLNQAQASSRASTANAGVYKVLVLDKFCKDVLSPLLKVNDLRKLGVTLHLGIEANRQPIPEVPAVYLVQPSSLNVSQLVTDASSGLYGEFHLNFVSYVTRPLLEQLAQGLVKANASEKISKIYDQYLAFISLEKNLFSLGLPNCYMELNDPSAKDTQIEASVSSVVDGLFCCFATLGTVPIIHCPKGGAAEHIASALDEKIRSSLKAKNNLFSETSGGLASSLSRPLLVLFERNFDLSVAVQHTWSYKPLVQDVLGLNLNRIRVQNAEISETDGAGVKTSHYDVDDEDFFWELCGSHPFPKVAEEVETQLQNYKNAVEEVNKKTAAQSPAMESDDVMQQSTENLMSAVSSLPELTEKKKVIDKHTNVATALLKKIKERSLDQFYNMEEDILAGKAEHSSVISLLQKGNAQDKLRLALVYLLAASPSPSDSEITEIETALDNGGANKTAFQYVRTLCKNNLAGNVRQSGAMYDGGAAKGSQSNLLSWAEKNLAQGLTSVTKSVKNLLSGARRSPIVSVLEGLMDGKSDAAGVEGFRKFDPKGQAGVAAVDAPGVQHRAAVVFMIGGGNYLEREALDLWAKSGAVAKEVVYGATEIVSPEEFLHHLAELGQRSGIA